MMSDFLFDDSFKVKTGSWVQISNINFESTENRCWLKRDRQIKFGNLNDINFIHSDFRLTNFRYLLSGIKIFRDIPSNIDTIPVSTLNSYINQTIFKYR